MATDKQLTRIQMSAKEWDMGQQLKDLIYTKSLKQLSTENASQLIHWIEYRDENTNFYKLAVNRLKQLPDSDTEVQRQINEKGVYQDSEVSIR